VRSLQISGVLSVTPTPKEFLWSSLSAEFWRIFLRASKITTYRVILSKF
jgi:hypothetical protein